MIDPAFKDSFKRPLLTEFEAEALYYLADSLYLKRDYLSSRRFFEKIVEAGPGGARYQESLQRLIAVRFR